MNLNLGDTQLIIEECKKLQCLRNQTAYILATAYHETAHTMEPVEEAYWLSDGWRKKNLRYYPWHGRGHVQMTWKNNYVRAARELGLPFDKEPALALQSEPSVKCLVRGCMKGWWTGKSIGDYITLQKSDFYGARRVVNGLDKASEIAKLAKQYDEALEKIGYGITDARDIPKPTAKPKIFKHIGTSKEIIAGGSAVVTAAGGLLSQLNDTSQTIVTITLCALLLIGGAVVANRF